MCISLASKGITLMHRFETRKSKVAMIPQVPRKTTNVVMELFSTETERPSGRQPWYSLETLKTSFSVSSEYQGCYIDELSVSVKTKSMWALI